MRKQEGKQKRVRELGSKHFGRSIRTMRLSMALSQEQLAAGADVSVAVLGALERERGGLSVQTLCSICLGLESEAGRPMLKAVFDGAMVSLWKELRSAEAQARADRGWAAPAYASEEDSAEETFRRHLDSYLDSFRDLSALVFRRILGTAPGPLELVEPLPAAAKKRVRIRHKTHHT